jgi:autotransporter adhesin
VCVLAVMATMTACGTQAAPNGVGAASGPASTRSSSAAQSTAIPALAGDLARVRAAGLPDNPQAVTAFLGKLPSVVAGYARTAITLKDTTYADGTQFVAAPLAETSPGLSMRASLDRFMASGQ